MIFRIYLRCIPRSLKKDNVHIAFVVYLVHSVLLIYFIDDCDATQIAQRLHNKDAQISTPTTQRLHNKDCTLDVHGLLAQISTPIAQKNA